LKIEKLQTAKERARGMSKESKKQAQSADVNENSPTTSASIEAKNTDAKGGQMKAKAKATPRRRVTNPLEQAEYFGKQYTKSADLPDPTERLKALAYGLVQVMSGERPIDQIAAWVSDEVYQRLRIKTQGTLAAIRAGKVKANRLQNLQVGSMKTTSPRDGVVESVVLLRSQDRTRAVTIRLEGINNRWRATSVSLL
jgi:hypothetical protein